MSPVWFAFVCGILCGILIGFALLHLVDMVGEWRYQRRERMRAGVLDLTKARVVLRDDLRKKRAEGRR